MKSDVSGNDTFEDYPEEVLNNPYLHIGEDYPTSIDNYEYQSSEIAVSAYDYTSNFENLQNSMYIANALLLASLILIGVLMGLKK